jgi:hypothetical protein
MAHFFIESCHLEEDCLEAHDQVATIGMNVFSRYYWSCPEAHAGWALVEAEDEQEALANIPERFQSTARIVRAEKMTPEKLLAAHSNL